MHHAASRLTESNWIVRTGKPIPDGGAFCPAPVTNQCHVDVLQIAAGNLAGLDSLAMELRRRPRNWASPPSEKGMGNEQLSTCGSIA
jgi:hypothetical protein